MLNNRLLACTVLAITALLAGQAIAQVSALIFEREDIRISSPAREEGTEQADGKKPAPNAAHEPLTFNVEIRSEEALRLEYIHTLNSLTETSGVMITFNAPSIVSLPAFRVPTPVDAVFVLSDGTIEQILPNVVLADLTREITSRKPFQAFLFLKAGTVAAQHIKPQDVITASVFSAAPPLMQ